MSKLIFILALFVLASAIVSVNAGGCYPCGGSFTPTQNSAQQAGTDQQYTAHWGKPPGFAGTGCFWCATWQWNAGLGIQSCFGLAASINSSCDANGFCIVSNSTTWISANPNAVNKATCESTAPIWVSWAFLQATDMKCGCSQTGVGRDEAMTKYHLPEDEFEMIEARASMEGRQVSPDCTHSLVCDPSTSSNCPDSSCPSGANAIIPCSSIINTTQNCPGYYAAPWANSSCPMQQGGLCPICTEQACKGTYSQQNCSRYGFNFACLECHVIVLTGGVEVCGAHMAPSQSECFCAPNWNLIWCSPDYNLNIHRGEDLAARQSGSGSGSGSGNMAPGANTYSPNPNQGGPPVAPIQAYAITQYCAPWGESIQTMHCVAGQGANARIATPADCRAGMATRPSCSNAYSCGGRTCGNTAGGYGQTPQGSAASSSASSPQATPQGSGSSPQGSPSPSPSSSQVRPQ